MANYLWMSIALKSLCGSCKSAVTWQQGEISMLSMATDIPACWPVLKWDWQQFCGVPISGINVFILGELVSQQLSLRKLNSVHPWSDGNNWSCQVETLREPMYFKGKHIQVVMVFITTAAMRKLQLIEFPLWSWFLCRREPRRNEKCLGEVHRTDMMKFNRMKGGKDAPFGLNDTGICGHFLLMALENGSYSLI